MTPTSGVKVSGSNSPCFSFRETRVPFAPPHTLTHDSFSRFVHWHRERNCNVVALSEKASLLAMRLCAYHYI